MYEEINDFQSCWSESISQATKITWSTCLGVFSNKMDYAICSAATSTLIAKWCNWESKQVSVTLSTPIILIAVKYAVDSQQPPPSSLPPQLPSHHPTLFFWACFSSTCSPLTYKKSSHRNKQEQQWSPRREIHEVKLITGYGVNTTGNIA